MFLDTEIWIIKMITEIKGKKYLLLEISDLKNALNEDEKIKFTSFYNKVCLYRQKNYRKKINITDTLKMSEN